MGLDQKLVAKYPMLGSSVDPTQLSMTAQGVMTAIIPAVAWVLRAKGVEVDQSLLSELGDGILQVVTIVGSLVSAVQIVYGLIRKFVGLLKK